MAKRRNEDTTVRLPADFAATVKALLGTPPPPTGDPSMRKVAPKKARKKKKAASR
jgi:hypothetical protein